MKNNRMGQKTIAKIRQEYQAAELQMLPEFICMYKNDARAGVRKLAEQAEKPMKWAFMKGSMRSMRRSAASTKQAEGRWQGR